MSNASVWNPAGNTVVQANAGGLVKEEVVIATAGQTVVNISTFAYTPNTGSLLVFKNDTPLERIADYTETATNAITLVVPASVGDRFMLVGFVGTTGVVATDTVLRADLAGTAGATLVKYLSPATAAALGSLKDRIHVIDAVADYQWDPTFTLDKTSRINDLFVNVPNNSIVIIASGNYKYTPDMTPVTGKGYATLLGKINVHIFAYGANFTNSFVVTTAPLTTHELHGVQMIQCIDCSVRGLGFDGNRDKTFGTNADGNEGYSAFATIECIRCGYVDVRGQNCQGDGLSNNRYNGNTGFNVDCYITGNCYFAGNRRNEMSIGGDYRTVIGGNIRLFGSSDAHRTSPMTGIDLEWEHATIGPVGNNTGIVINGVTATGSMQGGSLYIPNTSGVTVSNFESTTAIGVVIDNTQTGNYETQDIVFGPGVKLNNTYGIGIFGGANISMVGSAVSATYPITVNSPLSANPYKWCASFTDMRITGESAFAISVLQGRTRFNNNMCYNSSSLGGGTEYMALFRPECEVIGNNFFRDGNQPAPTNGIVVSNSLTVLDENNFHIVGAITHRICYGENNVKAVPAARTNWYNGNLIEDVVSTSVIQSQIVDLSDPTPKLFYTPQSSEMIDLQYVGETIGVNVVSTTAVSIGTIATPSSVVNGKIIDQYALDGVSNNITSAIVSGNTTSGQGLYITPTPGNNDRLIQLTALVRYNRSLLYTSPVLFS